MARRNDSGQQIAQFVVDQRVSVIWAVASRADIDACEWKSL